MADVTLESIPEFLAENEGATLDEWWATIDREAARLPPWEPRPNDGWMSQLLASMTKRTVRSHVEHRVEFTITLPLSLRPSYIVAFPLPIVP